MSVNSLAPLSMSHNASTESFQEDPPAPAPNAPGEPPNTTPALPEIDGMKTGLFLQQFTNSINRALHKQHCTCKGKLYSPTELIEKSNPGVFCSHSKGHKTKKKLRLPQINTDRSSEHEESSQHSPREEKPPLQTQIEREAKYARLYDMFMEQTIGDTGSDDEELRLPSIIDIRDMSGNSWKIMQEPRRGQKKSKSKSRFDRKLFGSGVSNHDRQISSKEGGRQETSFKKLTDNSAIEAVCKSNMTEKPDDQDDDIHFVGEEEDDVPSIDDSISEDTQSSIMEPHCQSVITRQTQVVSSPTLACDELGRKTLLWKYASAVRKGEMTYKDYLKKVSEMQSLYRDNDFTKKQQKRQISPRDDHKSTNKQRREAPKGIEIRVPTMHSLSSAYERNRTVRVNAQFPSELEGLYSRGGLKISNLSASLDSELPGNFLEKEKDDLREEYPMFDWKVERSKFEERLRLQKSLTQSLDSYQTPGKSQSVSVGIGPPNFDQRIKLKSNPGLHTQALVMLKDSQSLGKEGGVVELPDAAIVRKIRKTKDGEVRVATATSRGLPHQPPTTPVETALTYASCSAPNILETTQEEDENGMNNEEHMEYDAQQEAGNEMQTETKQEETNAADDVADRNDVIKTCLEVDAIILKERTFDSLEDNSTSYSSEVPLNPYNSKENLQEIGVSSDDKNNNSVFPEESVRRTSIQLIPLDILPEKKEYPTRIPLLREGSDEIRRPLDGDGEIPTSPKPFPCTQAFPGGMAPPVNLSTQRVVFISPLESIKETNQKS